MSKAPDMLKHVEALFSFVSDGVSFFSNILFPTSVRDDLIELVELQLLDTQLREVLSEQEGMPEEIEGLKHRAERLGQFIADKQKLQQDATVKKNLHRLDIKTSQEKIEKYKDQQKSARNNREYDAFSKQIDHEEKEIAKFEIFIKGIELSEFERLEKEEEIKKAVSDGHDEELNEADFPADMLVELKEKITAEIEKREKELSHLIEVSQEEVSALKERIKKKRERIQSTDMILLSRFDALLESGLENAVVPLERNSCGGCNSIVPKERHGSISKGLAYMCESCGRVVVSPSVFETGTKNFAATSV